MDGLHVLENQMGTVAGGGGAPAAAADEPFSLGEFTDKRVPNLLAGMVIGSVGALVLLRMAGFRFSFGASIGGGSGG